MTNRQDSDNLVGAEKDAYQSMARILQTDQNTASRLGAILDKILTAKEELERADDEKKDKAAKVCNPQCRNHQGSGKEIIYVFYQPFPEKR